MPPGLVLLKYLSAQAEGDHRGQIEHFVNSIGHFIKWEFDSKGLGWCPRLCRSNKLPSDVNAAGPQTII